MVRNAPVDVLSVVAEMTGKSPEQIRAASAADRKQLFESVTKDPGWPERFRQFNINTREQLSGAVETSTRKGWFREFAEENLYSKDHPILGTLWKWVSAKPVEGIVNSIPLVNRIPYIGRIARVAAVSAMVYFGWGYLRNFLAGWHGEEAAKAAAGRAAADAPAAGLGETGVINEYLQKTGEAAGGGTGLTPGNAPFVSPPPVTPPGVNPTYTPLPND